MTTINHECYVSLEVAKLLKKAGFDWSCRGYYDRQILRFNFVWEHNGKGTSTQCSAPTLEVAQRWLREVNDMLISTLYTSEGWKAVVTYPKPLPKHIHLEYVFCEDTYESALEAGIKKALEIILEKGE